jgi:hypothetical protein
VFLALFGVFGATALFANRKCFSHARTIYAEVVEGEGEAQNQNILLDVPSVSVCSEV